MTKNESNKYTLGFVFGNLDKLEELIVKLPADVQVAPMLLELEKMKENLKRFSFEEE